MQMFDLSSIATEGKKKNQAWLEFLQVSSLSMGLYSLKAGQADHRFPFCGQPGCRVSSPVLERGSLASSSGQRNEFLAYQASPRGGVVKVRVTKDRAFLGGRAVIVATGELLA